MLVKRFYPATRTQNNSLDSVLSSFWNDFERNFFRPQGSNGLIYAPAVNISENEDAFEIEMTAPGLSKKDIQINVDGDILRISANKTVEKKEGDEKNYTLREFNFSQFERTFTLPESVDSQNISAKFKNGILFLTLAKKEEAKPIPPRTIEIS